MRSWRKKFIYKPCFQTALIKEFIKISNIVHNVIVITFSSDIQSKRRQLHSYILGSWEALNRF